MRSAARRSKRSAKRNRRRSIRNTARTKIRRTANTSVVDLASISVMDPMNTSAKVAGLRSVGAPMNTSAKVAGHRSVEAPASIPAVVATAKRRGMVRGKLIRAEVATVVGIPSSSMAVVSPTVEVDMVASDSNMVINRVDTAVTVRAVTKAVTAVKKGLEVVGVMGTRGGTELELELGRCPVDRASCRGSTS
jgi:hypothetical protein